MRHGFEPYNTWDLLTQQEIDTPTVKTSLKATCQYSNFYSLLSRNSLKESLLISTTSQQDIENLRLLSFLHTDLRFSLYASAAFCSPNFV